MAEAIPASTAHRFYRYMESAPSPEIVAEQARQALERALSEIRTDADAEALIQELLARAAARTVVVVPAKDDAARARRAAAIARVVHAVHDQGQSAPEIFAAAARELAAAMPREGSALDEGVLRATNPGPAGEGQAELEGNRRRLRRALVKHLKPLQAVDTSLFLDINQLPHPRWANAAMRGLTVAMKRADLMAVGLFVAALRNPKRGAPALADVLPSLWLSTFIVETPVKRFFRRKRPFIDIVRATVVGRRPSSFSFPSGHSAAAFAGATLLCRHYPRRTRAFYLLAVLVGFSRVYLGAHYPGDVVTGGVGGTVLAEISHALLTRPLRNWACRVYKALDVIRRLATPSAGR